MTARVVRPAVVQERAMSSIVDKIKEFFIFQPNATSYETYPNKAVSGKGYRYPSPASQSNGANVPSTTEDKVYNTQYYTRDTARNREPAIAVDSDVAKSLGLPEVGTVQLEGSPGNNNPAVLRYDETGTRSAMSATWGGMNSELSKNMPTQLPTPWHLVVGIDEEAWTKERNLPPRPGKPSAWSGVRRDGAW
eukprot:CAMPEP_0184524684 /NCGR_PEP_ID=MMETSP0198_2-20121128/9663_1 /TAXON_ID=1112570 /ORGANISM="Thraustochytrium sp., Strain LLF1b" /LENGTH=191 /DNA_ID=CAMNT_0026916027 /DNA_START=60 /DNA_END=635 /DNA_ORIENTATION=-